jgi:hypothetical protein
MKHTILQNLHIKKKFIGIQQKLTEKVSCIGAIINILQKILFILINKYNF